MMAVMAVTAGSPVTCPRCGAPAVWHASSNQWGCDHCRQLIGGPPQPAMPPGPFATQPAPQCPRCWGNGTWQPAVAKWGCDRCKTYLDPSAVGHVAQNANDAGLKIAKFMMWLILMIALIAIKVALRSHR
jgi:ribosomal protein L37AE/L43A